MQRYRGLFFAAMALTLSLDAARAGDPDCQSFYDQIQTKLEMRDFATLEAQAGALRRNDRHFAGGVSGLFVFYRAVSARPLGGDGWSGWSPDPLSDAVFEKHRDLLEAWRHVRPESDTPKIALALLWSGYAWQARGDGFSNTVSLEQWKVFGERIHREEVILRDLAPADPGAYGVLLSLARDIGWSRLSIDRLYREALQKYPSYLHFYFQRAHLLEPRWMGAPGELAEYAGSLLRDPGGDIGLMAYSLVATHQLWLHRHPRHQFFAKTGLQWPEVKAGFERRERRYGLSKSDWNLLLYFASGARDRPAALKAVEHIGDDWARWFWVKREPFDVNVAWARAAGP